MAITAYTISFKDIKERTVEIQITNGQTGGETKVLTPASHPLTTSEDDDLNPMLPIRSTVAQIRVVCTHAEIIPIQSNLQWSVKIIRTEGNTSTTMWQGYLRAEMPDMEYSPIPDEITYIADDILGVMKYRQKNIDGNKDDFATLLTNVYNYLDNSIPLREQGLIAPDTLTSLYAESYNWVERKANDVGVMENRSDMQDVVESDILRFLGVTARYYNNTLYLGSLFGTRYYVGNTQVIPTPLDGETFTWMGFHTIKWEQGVGLINLTAAGRSIDASTLPELSDDYFQITEVGWMPPQTGYQPLQYNCYYRALSTKKCWTFRTEGTSTYPWGIFGAYVVDYDIWTEQSPSDLKSNFTFTRAIFFNCEDASEFVFPSFSAYSHTSAEDAKTQCDEAFYGWLETAAPFIQMRSEGAIFTNDGGFTLDINLQWVDYHIISGYRHIDGFNDVSGAVGLVFQLQYGDKFWNGQSWQDYECFFIEGRDTIKQKTIAMSFRGEGYAMPTPGVQSGDLILKIYGAYLYTEEEDDVGGPTYYSHWTPNLEWYKFDKLELKYNTPIDILAVNKEDKRKLSQRTPQFPEENAESVDLKLCSAGDIDQNWGFVFDGNTSNIIETMHWPKLRQTWMPERLVLKKHTLVLSRLRSFATLTMECEYDNMPFLRIALDGRTWYPMAIKTEWRDCKSEVLVADITDIMAALPLVGTDEETSGYTRVLNIESGAQGFSTFELSAAIDEPLTITWAANGLSGEETIATGETGTGAYTGEIHDMRDFDTFEINTPSGKYTIMITLNGYEA